MTIPQTQKTSTTPRLSPIVKAQRRLLVLRIAVVIVLVACSLFFPYWLPKRAVDPSWFSLEPLVGAMLFWPLSSVFVRIAGTLWGFILSFVPAVSLILIRIYGSQRDLTYGTDPNLSFGAMIFLGICSLAAYLLFRRPPRR